MSTRSVVADCGEVQRQLTRALRRHDRAGARRIYYTMVLPNPGFDREEVDDLAHQTGVIDEGDDHLAHRRDL